MEIFSQEELQKILSLETKPVPKAGPELRFRRFVGPHNTNAYPECKLTQDEVDRVFAKSGARSTGA